MTAAVAAIVSLVVAAITSFATIEVSKMNVRGAYLNHVRFAILTARIKYYPALFKITLQLSTRRPMPLTKEDAIELGHKVNAWLYGRGGLFASFRAREAVGELKTALLNWNDNSSLDDVRKPRSRMIYALRADINLQGDLNVNPERVLPLDWDDEPENF